MANFCGCVDTQSFTQEEDAMVVDYFTEDDLPEFSRWFTTADEVLQFGGPELAFPFSEQFLHSLTTSGAQSPASNLTFAGRSGDRLVGAAQLHFHWEHQMAILARVVINPELRGRGMAFHLLEPLVQAFFADQRMARLELSVYSFNTAAIRTYSRLGFVYEGIRRANVQASDGERWDTLVYGMLREDYLAQRERNQQAA